MGMGTSRETAYGFWKRRQDKRAIDSEYNSTFQNPMQLVVLRRSRQTSEGSAPEYGGRGTKPRLSIVSTSPRAPHPGTTALSSAKLAPRRAEGPT